jgi:GntR family transcriptional regulator/MocR family aminotransferase
VTSGAQQAFDLLARVLVRAGETVVAVEDPGYPPMRAAFAAAGARIAPVNVDAEGLIVEDLPPDAGIVCVCPSHQFPLGVTLSAGRRKALLAWARHRGAVIVEDDYDGEFRFEGGALEALRSADAADVVFYVGTFSKCMLPALRIGFVAAPHWALRSPKAGFRGMCGACARSTVADARPCWKPWRRRSATGWRRSPPSTGCMWRRSRAMAPTWRPPPRRWRGRG